MSTISPCPSCHGSNVARQRNPDGETICLDCYYCLKSTDWENGSGIDILLKNISYQYRMNQFLNASYECAELQKILLSKLSDVLKGGADASSK